MPAEYPIPIWFGTMLGSSGYQDTYRDKGPMLEEEDYRDEAMRGIWDAYSPPHVGGFIPGATDTYNETAESFATGQISRLNTWLITDTIRNTSAGSSKYSGYGSIYFLGRRCGRTRAKQLRRSGEREGRCQPYPQGSLLYFRVAGNTKPDIHIIGHWTYPAGTSKTMYVAANNVSSVDLLVNGKSQGR